MCSIYQTVSGKQSDERALATPVVLERGSKTAAGVHLLHAFARFIRSRRMAWWQDKGAMLSWTAQTVRARREPATVAWSSNGTSSTSM